ncbi:NADP-dependent oxidoreductase [Microlunatus elymi]|uniref:NADP-dependent oxidoreductase n=1 Tax=Microlunatus elymi TaxID=2596828 RepID=A0A516PXP9_9ACTN|nr:NADP-dependent oxidoreductase [Microlunatus elymi]QDP95959.1 NADP-dependent oxidoreductase [Microlunatus elymi]
MRAIAYEKFGSADVLQPVDLPKPHIGPDTVLVKVKAAAVNPVDYKIREGYLQGLIDAQFPVVPGWDVAGVVEQPGLDTPEFQAGDEILAYARADVVSGGTLAEYVAVPVRTAAHKPAELSFEEAAALPLAGLTALQSVRRAGVDAGSTVLVHAAAGGVGSFAVQLARHAGARVIGTGSPDNHDFLRSLGAEPIDYHGDLVASARELAPDGFDVILDYVGGTAIDTVPQLLKQGGVVASITDARARDEFGGQYVWVRPDAVDLAELAELAARGVVKIEISEVFDLDHAADAHRAVESGHTRGKVVVTA